MCPDASKFDYTVYVSVYTPLGDTVATTKYKTPGATYKFTGSDESFKIDPKTGDIMVNSYLTVDSYTLEVEATLEPSGQNDYAMIYIQTVPDDIITVFPQNYQEISMEENLGGRRLVCNIQSSYENTVDVTYSIVQVIPPAYGDYFDVELTTGELYTTAEFDYEEQKVLDVIVEATNQKPKDIQQNNYNYFKLNEIDYLVNLTNTQDLVRIFVVDANDEAPHFINDYITNDQLTMAISSYTSSGQEVIQLETVDDDTNPDYKNVTYSISGGDKTNFYFSKTNGLLMASTPLSDLEGSDKSYGVTVAAKNIEGGNSVSLNMKIYVLTQSQIMVITSSSPVEDFDHNWSEMLSDLSEDTNQDLRSLKYVSNGKGTTAYLYALSSSGPMSESQLMDLVKTHKDDFDQYGFDSGSATTFDKTPEASGGGSDTDTTGYIIGIAVLAAVLAVTLILGAIFAVKAHHKKSKLGKVSYDFGNNDNESTAYPDNHANGNHNQGRRLSEAFNTELKSEGLSTFGEDIIAEEANLDDVVHSDDHLYPDLESSLHHENEDLHQYPTLENLNELNNVTEHSILPSSDFPGTHRDSMNNHQADDDDDEPAKSILIDSSNTAEDTLEELQKKEELVVTFNEVPEVIAVTPNENNLGNLMELNEEE